MVTIKGYAFNACESLTEVIILNPNAYIGDYAETFSPEQAKIVGRLTPQLLATMPLKDLYQIYGTGEELAKLEQTLQKPLHQKTSKRWRKPQQKNSKWGGRGGTSSAKKNLLAKKNLQAGGRTS